ncbi:hypothetical protein [Kineosporia mesophila]|uniref:hypothetical protein n=1 Tax=Kineosporia mesophila TaxID=566012 RepID=UPI0038B2B304
MFGDRGCDSSPHCRKIRKLGITPYIACRKTANGSGLGVHRWPVERTFVRLHGFKRLRIRYQRRADIDQAFISPACSWICLRHLILN